MRYSLARILDEEGLIAVEDIRWAAENDQLRTLLGAELDFE